MNTPATATASEKLISSVAELFPETRQLLTERRVVDGESLANALLFDCVNGGISDIHLVPRSEDMLLRIRLDGSLLDAILLTHEEGMRVVRHMEAMADLPITALFVPAVSHRHVEVDGRVLDVRITVAPTVQGEAMALRLLYTERMNRSIEQLGLKGEDLEKLQTWLQSAAGMVLVTGPTGAGKTTTVYALLGELRKQNRNILSVEDPVEYQVDGMTQMQVDVAHGFTFPEGVRTMLRMDPDVMFLGEIRDAESAVAAIDAGTAGHLLISTMHSRDAVSAVSSFRNWGIPNHDLAAALELVIGQRLVRKLCPKCRTQRELTEVEQAWLQSMNVDAPEKTWIGTGCDNCFGTGYRGRTGIFEIWKPNEDDIKRLTLGYDEASLRSELIDRGYHNLLTNGMALVREGITSLEELRNLSGIPAPPAGKE